MANVKLKQPIEKGVAKVPLVIQLEALECGAACLTMILGYYKKWIPLEQVRADCGVSRDGSNAANVMKAAINYGLSAQGFRMEPDQLKEFGSFPCIIHWNFNHFVVLDGFRGSKACINDPEKGVCEIPMEEFDRSFTGIVLTFAPGENFEPSGTERNVWSYAKKRFKGLVAPLVFTVLATVIAALFGVISPVFDRIFYDRLLTGENPEWVTPFLIALGVLYAVQFLLAMLTAFSNLRMNGKLHAVGSLSYIWKVLHLPMHFFSQRMTGDIESRQGGNAVVSTALVGTLAPLVINGAMTVFYLLVMIKNSPLLTLFGLLSAVINLLLTNYLNKRRSNISRVLARDTGKLYADTVAGVQMIETVKSSGAEEGFFRKWAGQFCEANLSEQEMARQDKIFLLLTSVTSSLCGSVVLGIGLWLTVKGEFTVGSIVAFQGFMNAFLSPVGEMLNAGTVLQEMRTDMERIDDVMEYPDDPNAVSLALDGKEGISKLSGAIEISHVTFGYSPLAAPVIKDFSMSIKKGSRVAIVGSSGCGKSTVSKLVSGLYTPWEGEILFDGKPIREIDHAIFTGSLAVVDQDIIVFEDTVANNIKMWDNSIEDFEMILAAKDAQLHYDIISRPDGYQHRLTEGGKDFSGGQRQRLEIARVLAQEPNIIILDEATSALDAKTEYEVVSAIKDRGITCIVIAHRLSTIRDCDEIVVLDHGVAVERGTHEELMRQGGYYTQLITNE